MADLTQFTEAQRECIADAFFGLQESLGGMFQWQREASDLPALDDDAWDAVDTYVYAQLQRLLDAVVATLPERQP